MKGKIVKKTMILIAVIGILSLGTIIQAQEVPQTKVQRISEQLGITLEEATQLVNNMKQLAEVMGMEIPNENSTTPQGLTGAEVANKALDQASGMIAKISAQVEKAAPEVWRIMIKQQIANAVFWAIMPSGFLIGGLAYRKWVNTWDLEKIEYSSDKSAAEGFRNVTKYILLVVPSVWLIISGSYSIRYFINPEYYALRDLFKMVLGS